MRAPPSSGRFLSRPSRSRSRSSCSVGAIEKPQETGQRRTQLGARHDRVDLAVAEVLLGPAEVLGQLLARDLLHDARAGERHEGIRLRKHYVTDCCDATAPT